MRGQNADIDRNFESHEDYATWYAMEYHEFDTSAWCETESYDDNEDGWLVTVYDSLANAVDLLVWIDESRDEPIYEAVGH